MKILIVEDEPSLREVMQRALRQEGYVVETAATYAEADRRVSGYDYDCILLDIMLPDGNGLRLLERIKELRRKENVIIVSARDSLEDKVLGLDRGADDYLAKPFYPEELLARIKERFEVNPDVKVEEEIYHFANTVFDYSTNEIRTGNSKTLVTSRQAEILRILARNPNVAIDREIILSAVWGNVSYANSLVLNVQVTYLRKALRNDPLTSIVSLTKKGYMLKG